MDGSHHRQAKDPIRETRDWRTAERLAGELEKELEAGCISPSRVTWDEFQRRYTDEKLTALAPATKETALASLRHVKRVLEIEYLAKLTASAMSTFAAALRKEGMQDSTVAHHLRHVKAATRWAEKLGLMRKAPAVEMPRAAKGQSQARSRAVTGEEFDRMIAAVEKARPADGEQWTRYLTGLWLSGLRRSEALALTWDQDGLFCARLGENVFIIRADGQKSGKAETCPMAPDFAAWLSAVPEAERTGLVFRLTTRAGRAILPNAVGKIVEQIGKAAKVKVGTRIKRDKEGKPATVPVFAGCHSLRRGFGSKWARRVTPSVLKRLMRHASIATTEGYYVTMDAADVAAELSAAWGDKKPVAGAGSQQSSNSPPEERHSGVSGGIDATPDDESTSVTLPL